MRRDASVIKNGRKMRSDSTRALICLKFHQSKSRKYIEEEFGIKYTISNVIDVHKTGKTEVLRKCIKIESRR